MKKTICFFALVMLSVSTEAHTGSHTTVANLIEHFITQHLPGVIAVIVGIPLLCLLLYYGFSFDNEEYDNEE